jgi:YfiH family protein
MSSSSLLRPEWAAPSGVQAVCTLRTGGVSLGPYASLNMGAHVGDQPSAVSSNRARVRAQLKLPSEPLWLNQVHGTTVVDADAFGPLTAMPAAPPTGDAAFTRVSGRVLAVLVADCMPVLLTRSDGTAVAVAHAGWRGLAAGVLEASVAALGGRDADVLAWLGPAIGPAHFEVGDEVRSAFCERDGRAADAFARNVRGRWQCDLHRLARQRLQGAGVAAVHGDRRCTYTESQSFYSFRRDGSCGRLAALIWMQRPLDA